MIIQAPEVDGPDANQCKQMIENHFLKKPNHKITPQELDSGGWTALANERKRRRNELRRGEARYGGEHRGLEHR